MRAVGGGAKKKIGVTMDRHVYLGYDYLHSYHYFQLFLSFLWDSRNKCNEE